MLLTRGSLPWHGRRPGWLGAACSEQFLTAPRFPFLTGEPGWGNSLFFGLTGNFPSPFLSYSPHGHGLLLSGIISALWAQAFVWCSRHQIYCTLSEWPKEARFLLLKTPLARMTKGSLNCRHKGWEREKGTGPVRGDYDPPLPATHHGDGCAARPWNSSKPPACEKGNRYSHEGWSASVDGLPVCAGWEGALLETAVPLYPHLHLLTDL